MLATAEELKEFCRASLRIYDFEKQIGNFNASIRQIAVSTTKRPYVAYTLLQEATHEEFRKELPEKYLSEFADIVAFVFAQRNGESGFLNNDGCGNRFLVKGKDGEVLVMEVSADIKVHWYLSIWDFESKADVRHSDNCRFFYPGVAFL
jgi:hypothetical protein